MIFTGLHLPPWPQCWNRTITIQIIYFVFASKLVFEKYLESILEIFSSFLSTLDLTTEILRQKLKRRYFRKYNKLEFSW